MPKPNLGLAVFTFTVDGQPISQYPPRRVTKAGRTWTYRPEATKRYVKAVAGIARDLIKAPLPKGAPVRLWLDFYVKGKTVGRPDLDKIAASIFDALQSVIYDNDSQIVELITRKQRSSTPRVIITVEELPHDRQSAF